MNMASLSRFRVRRPELLIVALMLVATAALHQLGYRRSVLLGAYLWPVVLAGYYYGIRRALSAALATILLVTWFTLAVPGAFEPAPASGSERWIDLAVWAVLLLLTSGLVGRLYETRKRAFRELQQAFDGVLGLLAKFIDMADRYTEVHSARVSLYATALARRAGLEPEQVERIRVAALLHDIGKLDVDPELLRKDHALSETEWDQMRRHPAAGAWLIGRVGGRLGPVIPSILYHHERYDGSGYYGLRGEEIPLGARIIAVADTFDAMTTTRPYRAAMGIQEATRILHAQRGLQLDPELVSLFLTVLQSPDAPLDRLLRPGSVVGTRARPRREIAGL